MAITPAINDRDSFADAVGRDSDDGIEALRDAESFEKLRGRKIESLSEVERRIAMSIFLFAEQYETGFADSNPGKKYEIKSRKEAARYREVRLRRWGKTHLENIIENSKPVSIFEILEEKSCQLKNSL